jgi:tetratricopeptide (TPR) repeat protein
MSHRTADAEPNDGVTPAPPSDRLDSWKEIAAYLHRDVRTVQRWEKTAGLPVHRHATSRLRTAFAYRSELDAWWRSQRVSLEAAELPDDHHGAVRRSLGATAVAVGGLVAALAGALVVDRPAVRQIQPAASSHPVRVLVTPLLDQVGDGQTLTLLDQIVAGQLAQHPGVEVAAPRQVARVLRLMRREAARLTPSLGREVCIRGGRIRFVLAGRVQALPGRYVAVLEIVDPVDGRVRRSLHDETATVSGLLHVLRRQTRTVAGALVELAEEPAGMSPPLEEVTSPSLGAVRLYTAAVQAGARREWAAAELLARRALAADPQFAAAAAWVSWAMAQQGRPRDEFLPLAAEALALSKTTSDREAYLIAGMFHALSGDVRRAAAAYEALRRLEPEDPQVLDLLADTYARAGDIDPAATLAVTTARSRPNDFAANVRAARALITWRTDAASARPFVHRSRTLAIQDVPSERPLLRAWVQALPVFEHWRSGDLDGAIRAVETLAGSADGGSLRARDAIATVVGFSYLALGQVERASRWLRQASPGSRDLNLAMLALAIGDSNSARERLGRVPAESRRRPALYAGVGLDEAASRGLGEYLDSEHAAGMAATARGLIAARRGQHATAIASLREGLALLRFSGEPEYFLGAEALARVLTLHGQSAAGLRVLEDAAAERGRVYGGARWAGAFWLRVNVRLLAAYEQQGNRPAADALRKTLQPLLAKADADHPFMQVVRPGGGTRTPTAPRKTAVPLSNRY